MDVTHPARIAHLDILRGIAVLGILFMNITAMGIFELGYVHFDPVLTSDQIIIAFKALLMDGRFRSLFCLLFGVGLYLQYSRLIKQGLTEKQVQAILKSRLNWLLLFGFIHCTFIWPGDILMFYALGGWFVIKRLNRPAEQVIKLGIQLFAISLFIMAADVLLNAEFTQSYSRQSPQFLDNYALWTSGYLNQFIEQVTLALIYFITFPLLSLCYIAGIMLIAAGLYKQGLLSKGFDKIRVKQLLVITLGMSSIDILILLLVPSSQQISAYVLGSVSGLCMALLIWHWLAIQSPHSKLLAFLSPLKSVGRLAFSLYILQSITMVILFRWLMPEWNKTFGQVEFMLVCSLYTAVQILVANWYLQHYSAGPLEKLWRHLATKKLIKETQKQQAATQKMPETL
ncbi:DUF418 domain-containing protein [Saccharobesus litoralis]|nr:DUF418 domain-containing protein [Saccharobesus litoralis]